MKRTNLASRPSSSGYMDAIGRVWGVNVLDRLLSDATVLRSVRSLYVNALRDHGGTQDFSPNVVWSSLKSEHSRKEVVALYLLLVVRYRDVHVPAPASSIDGEQA